jgi:Holliday junction resolvasome RuvABC endonuclease subunit
MKKILSFDVSSSTIGYSVIEYDLNSINLVEYGNVKPPKSDKGSLSYRALSAVKSITTIVERVKPDEVAIEDYAKRFSAGRSTARTIIVLSFFNELMCLTVLDKLNIEAYRYPVITIRSSISHHLSIKTISKEDMFKVICDNFKNFLPKKNKVGGIKEESFDEADAIAVGFCHAIKMSKK